MTAHLYTRHRVRARSGLSRPAETIDPRAIAARRDFDAFCAYVCNQPGASHHLGWDRILVTGQSNDTLRMVAGPNTNLLAPRGSAKSTRVARLAAWVIGHNPGIQIIYASYSESVALKQSRLIKRIIKTRAYQQVFPHIKPGKRWSDTDWEIDKTYAGVTELDSDYTLYAVGITGAVTSRRAHLILLDDLIKSSAAIANEDIRQKMLDNWAEVLEPTLIPGGRVLSIGTRFRKDDIHATTFTPENDWSVIEQSAIVESQSYWPERFTFDFLRKKQIKNPVIFSYQYQNVVPPDADEQIIKPEWIAYGIVPRKFDELLLAVDLAASEKQKGDYTAFVLLGRVGAKYYVVEAIRDRISGNLEKIRRILELRKKWGDFRVLVERVAYQSSFSGDWRDEMKRRRLNLRCEEFIPKGDKDQRLEGVSGLFANNLVILNRDRPMSDLVGELLRISTDHDDLSDACVMGLSRLQKKSRKPLSAA